MPGLPRPGGARAAEQRANKCSWKRYEPDRPGLIESGNQGLEHRGAGDISHGLSRRRPNRQPCLDLIPTPVQPIGEAPTGQRCRCHGGPEDDSGHGDKRANVATECGQTDDDRDGHGRAGGTR